ncbi:MAG TPA: proton-translocating transhydrogenase family protein, partial [Gemmatimonadaceae bacterium]|nr:proton-translocating transhydrogenase family protein [Gemmatimonadaceae bacterium]
MTNELILGIYVFILAIFVGFEVISRVPSVLHTPLMSATNAIHGIVVLGAMLVMGAANTPLL